MTGITDDFPRWVKAHRIAIAAWISIHRGADSGWRQIAREVISSSVVRDSARSSYVDLAVLQGLPSYTLHLLSKVPDLQLPGTVRALYSIDNSGNRLKFRNIISDVLKQKAEARGRRRPSKTRGPRIVAEHILRHHGNAQAVVGLARTVIGYQWRDAAKFPRFVRSIDEALPILRNSFSPYQDKLAAIAAMSKAFENITPDYLYRGYWQWPTVEFHLLNGIHVWPLVVLGGEVTEAVGIALPLAFDLKQATRARLRINNVTGIKLDGWEAGLRRAYAAALDLYRLERNNQSEFWMDIIENSDLACDIQAASAILKPFSRAAAAPDFSPSGRSLEGYMAICVLARLLGQAIPPSFAMTGIVGSAVRVNDIRSASAYQRGVSRQAATDRVLEVPGYCRAKVEWVDASQQFDRMVLPDDENHNEIIEVHRYLADTNVRVRGPVRPQLAFCNSLSIAADAAIVAPWRRYAFVRCPDIFWYILNGGTLDDSEVVREQIRQLFDLLSDNTGTILYLPDSISPAAVVTAMNELNSSWRQAQSPTPKKLVYRFVRLAPDQVGSQLISLICVALGAPNSAILDLMNADSDVDARNKFASLMNTWSGSIEAPFLRAPDVLVLVRPPTTDAEANLADGGPLHFENVFNADLDRLLDTFREQAWGPRLGRTRIIVVPDTEPHSPSQLSAQIPLDEADRGDLRALSIFRYGFTQQMAAILISDRHKETVGVRETLHRLVKIGALKRAGYKYFLPASDREKIIPNDAEVLVELHMRAAAALAPFLTHEGSSGLTDSEARQLESVHESQFHIQEIIRLGQPEIRVGQQAKLMQLVCLFDFPSWDVVCSAASIDQSEKLTPLRLALEFTEKRRSGGGELSGREQAALLRLLAIASMRGNSLLDDPNDETEKYEFPVEFDITCRLQEELRACLLRLPNKLQRGPSAQDVYLASCWSTVASELGDHEIRRRVDEIDELVVQAIQTNPAVNKFVLQSWLERAAKKAKNRATQQSLCRLGTTLFPRSIQFWLRALAVADGNEKVTGEVFESLERLRSEDHEGFARMKQWGDDLRSADLDRETRAGWQHFIEWMEADEARAGTSKVILKSHSGRA